MTAPHRNQRQGFTLIELMIVVAIIGILSSTAVALFRTQQLRAKRAEAITNLSALGHEQTAYFGEFGKYVTHPPMPAGSLTPHRRQWDIASDTMYGDLGFKIEGGVFYSYDTVGDTTCCASGSCFTAAAYGDLDGDGATAVIGYFHPQNATTFCGTQLFPALGPFVPRLGKNVFDAPVLTAGSDDF